MFSPIKIIDVDFIEETIIALHAYTPLLHAVKASQPRGFCKGYKVKPLFCVKQIFNLI